MSKKCHWEGKDFISCCCNIIRRYDPKGFTIAQNGFGISSNDFIYCPFCGANIRPPKPEVIIKQSGQTWVARYDGTDWLCVNPDYYGHEICEEDLAEQVILGGDNWIKFDKDTEITDEIAKCRPKVILIDGPPLVYTLCAVLNNTCVILDRFDDSYVSNVNHIRIATIVDLP